MAEILEEHHNIEENEVLLTKSSVTSIDSDLFEHKEKTSFTRAAWNLFKLFIGTGILALPASFYLAGNGLAFLSLIGIAILTYYATMLAVEVAIDLRQDKAETIQGIGYRVLGNKVGISGELCNFVMQSGTCIAYIIYFNNFLEDAFCGHHIEYFCGNTTFNIILAIALVGPLLLVHSMHFLSNASLVGMILTLWGLLALIIYNIIQIHESRGSWDYFTDTFTTFNLSNWPSFFGVAVYSFEGIGVMFTVRSSMEQPSKFGKLLKIMFIFCFCLYSLTSLMATNGFRDDIKQIVILGLPKRNFYYFSAQILYAVGVILAFPGCAYPVFEIIEHKVNKKFPIFDEEKNVINKPLRHIIRFVFLAITIIIAFTTKSFYYFIAFLGSLAFNYLGLIYPIIVYQKHFSGTISKVRTVINYCLLVLLFVVGIFGVHKSFMNLISPKTSIKGKKL